IHSNVPVGVIGGSQCPFIPVDKPYCDHVLDMMPPVRTWSKTYYSAPFTKRKNGDTFLILGSTNNQIIYRTNGSTRSSYATVNRGVPFWDNSVTEPYRWESDSAFLLVQYINSSTNDGVGVSSPDPAEVVINSVEQFAKTVVFQTPAKQGGQLPYTNYANLIVNAKADSSTT